MSAVAQNHVAHIAHAQPVHQHIRGGDAFAQAGLDMVGILAVKVADLYHLAIGDGEDVLLGHIVFFGQAGVQHQVAIFAVGRDEETGAHQLQHAGIFVPVAVAGDMDMGQGMVDHFHPLAEEIVDGAVEQLLVAGDGRGADHHRVAGAQLDLAMFAHAHAHHSAGGFTLAACGDHHDLVAGQILHLVGVEQFILGDIQIAQGAGDLDVVDHRASGHADFAPVFAGSVDDLLHAADVAGKGTEQHPARRLGEDLVQADLDGGFAGRGARSLGVGAVRHQQQHPFVAPLLQLARLGQLAIRRRGIKLVVAGMDDAANRGLDGQAHAVREAVAGVEELHGEAADLDFGLRGDRVQRHFAQQPVLAQLAFQQPAGQRRGIDWGLQPLFDHVGQAADVVFVAVGQEDAFDRVQLIQQVFDVGDHDIYAVHLRGGEHQAHINDDDVVVVFHNHHIFADFAHAAQGQDAQKGRFGPLFFILRGIICLRLTHVLSPLGITFVQIIGIKKAG